MARITERKRKTASAFIIEFTLERRRRSLFLSSVYTRDDAEDVSKVVDRVVASIETGAPLDRRAAAFLATASNDMRERFVKVGLLEPDRRETLRDLFDSYAHAEYGKLKPNSIRVKDLATRIFFNYVDENTLVEKFSKLDAREFAGALTRSHYSPASRASFLRDIKRVFSWAADSEIIARSPFDGVARGSGQNKSREYFVTREEYNKMLDVCETPRERALLSLYRIGGLRLAEANGVLWKDVDFERGRILVRSPKTEHHVGKESRVIPLYPELRRDLLLLKESFAASPSPSECVVGFSAYKTRYVVLKIVKRANLTRWERLIQNMRSSRAIEVFTEFGAIAESEWIGHSYATAKAHYLHLLDADFEKATREHE